MVSNKHDQAESLTLARLSSHSSVSIKNEPYSYKIKIVFA